MLHAMFLQGLSGPPAKFGDDDGGRLFDPARNRDEHLLDPLATGAILFDRVDFRALAGDLREETLWLLGAAGIDQWDSLEKKPVVIRSAALENAGIYILASKTAHLVVDGGASLHQSSGHEHADALSVCLQSAGRQLLIDPGTYEYVGEGPERNQFRGTALHNTLRINNKDQAEPSPAPFAWTTRFRAQAEQWIAGESFDFFVGSHDGYQRLPSSAVHRRWVIGLKAGIFLVRDRVEGEGEHRLDVSWHLAQDLQLQAEGLFRFKNSAQGLAMLTVAGHDWSEEVHKGAWSPVYGQQRTATVFNFGTTATLPAEFATLLMPLEEAYAAAGTLKVLQEPQQTSFVRVYIFESETREVRFYFGEAGQPWNSRAVASDAEFVCISRSRVGGDPDVILCNGSYVEVDGLRVLHTKHRVTRCELLRGEISQVFCSEPESLVAPVADSPAPAVSDS